METQKLTMLQIVVIGFALYGAYQLFTNLKLDQRFYPSPERHYSTPMHLRQAARFGDTVHKIQPFRNYPIQDNRSCAPYC